MPFELRFVRKAVVALGTGEVADGFLVAVLDVLFEGCDAFVGTVAVRAVYRFTILTVISSCIEENKITLSQTGRWEYYLTFCLFGGKITILKTSLFLHLIMKNEIHLGLYSESPEDDS